MAGRIARGEVPDPRKNPEHADKLRPGRPRKKPTAAEVDAAAMAAAAPNAQLNRNLRRAEELRAAQAAEPVKTAQEAPEPREAQTPVTEAENGPPAPSPTGPAASQDDRPPEDESIPLFMRRRQNPWG